MPYTISIGRGPSNDIVINQPAVSNSHAIITFAEDGTIIYSDNSTNGTNVNGKFVRGRSIYIRQGDQVLLPGNVLLNWSTINSRNPYSSQRNYPRQEPYAPAPQPVQHVESGTFIVDEHRPQRNMCGLLSLILSLAAIPCYFIPYMFIPAVLLAGAAFILGIIGVCSEPKGEAIAGLIISIVTPLILWLIFVNILESLSWSFMFL